MKKFGEDLSEEAEKQGRKKNLNQKAIGTPGKAWLLLYLKQAFTGNFECLEFRFI
ncbi:MAG: hypothetical protein HGA26_09125 [Chlorobiaceae bacterium]|nr:hypothetical protein [Chlorobiaceae bacterium]